MAEIIFVKVYELVIAIQFSSTKYQAPGGCFSTGSLGSGSTSLPWVPFISDSCVSGAFCAVLFIRIIFTVVPSKTLARKLETEYEVDIVAFGIKHSLVLGTWTKIRGHTSRINSGAHNYAMGRGASTLKAASCTCEPLHLRHMHGVPTLKDRPPIRHR